MVDWPVLLEGSTSRAVGGIAGLISLIADENDVLVLEVFAKYIVGGGANSELYVLLSIVSSNDPYSMLVWETMGIRINGRRRGFRTRILIDTTSFTQFRNDNKYREILGDVLLHLTKRMVLVESVGDLNDHEENQVIAESFQLLDIERCPPHAVQPQPLHVHWAQCDYCGKWRTLSRQLANGEPFICGESSAISNPLYGSCLADLEDGAEDGDDNVAGEGEGERDAEEESGAEVSAGAEETKDS